MNIRKPKKPFRVLAIDGGGMRGLFVAELLKYLIINKSRQLEKELKDFGKAFDLIAGTSTGGILACALSAGADIDEVINLYKQRGNKIFPVTKNYFSAAKSLLKNLKYSIADEEELKQALDEMFGNKTLEDIYKSRKIALCIPAVNYVTSSAKVFKTPHFKGDSDKELKLVDICMATSAAPVFFNPYFFDVNSVNTGFIDGGLWANNPVMVGLTEALDICGDDREIEIISIGIFAPKKSISTTDKEMGVLDWTVIPMVSGKNHLVNLVLDSQSSGAHSTAKRLIKVLNSTRKNKIKLVRWPTGQLVSEGDKKYMDMDSASDESLKVMNAYAAMQALEISSAIKEDEDLAFIEDIFKEMS